MSSHDDGRLIAPNPMDADNELYDAACELLAATQRLSRAAAADGVEPAVPATLGCITTGLGALTVTCAALGRAAGTSQRTPIDELVHALRRAHRAGELARASAALGRSTSACDSDAPP